MGIPKIASLGGRVASCGAVLTMLGAAFFVSGCATAPTATPVATAPALAHLVVINQTDYDWHIVINRLPGESAYDGKVQRRATVTIDLAGGEYVIEQTVLLADAAPELTRKIPSKLESGQTYRWRLVTLLSEPTSP